MKNEPYVEAISKLRTFDDLYAEGNPAITDAQYDNFKLKVKTKYPDHPYFQEVGAPVPDNTPWKTIKHDIPMGSIANIEPDPENFVESILENTKKWFNNYALLGDILIQHKLDGLSVSLKYNDHKLSHAILRGDGQFGEDILRNVIKMRNVRRELPINTLELRGEIILSREALIRINKTLEAAGEKTYANCRNAAAGIARRLDGKFSNELKIIYFTCIGASSYIDENSTDEKLFTYMHSLDLETVSTLQVTSKDFQDIVNQYTTMIKDRDNLNYDIDGLVIKVNDLDARQDMSLKPEWIRAMKFPPEEKLFTVDDILWEVGKTGKVNPVLHCEAGTQFQAKIVHRVTLHNYNQFCLHKIAPQDKVSVVISGDVIPKIEQVKERSGNKMFEAPKACPECNSILRIEEKFLFCDAEGCPGRVKSLINAHVKVMDIEECGPELVEKLYDLGQRNIIQFNDMASLYQLTIPDILKVEGYQRPSAEKVWDNIQAAKTVSLEKFIASLGIPSIGEKKVAKIKAKSINEITAMSLEHLKNIQGIGGATAIALKEGLEDNYALIGKLLANGVKIKEKQEIVQTSDRLKDKTFCFTGNVDLLNPDTRIAFKREELQELVVQNGGINKSGVSKKLDYLVIADPASTSSKATKARKYGTQLISPEEFLKLVGLL